MATRKPRKKKDPFEVYRSAVAAEIRRIRRAKDLTQEEAASRAGFDFRYWGKIESGDLNPTLRTLFRVASALGVGVAELVRQSSSTN